MGSARMGSNPIGVAYFAPENICACLEIRFNLRVNVWSYGVTVSTLDFESSDGGSNPPGTFYDVVLHPTRVFFTQGNMLSSSEHPASLAQLVARRSHNPKVVSSILTGGSYYLFISRHGG